jgi:hypothetical protein
MVTYQNTGLAGLVRADFTRRNVSSLPDQVGDDVTVPAMEVQEMVTAIRDNKEEMTSMKLKMAEMKQEQLRTNHLLTKQTRLLELKFASHTENLLAAPQNTVSQQQEGQCGGHPPSRATSNACCHQLMCLLASPSPRL